MGRRTIHLYLQGGRCLTVLTNSFSPPVVEFFFFLAGLHTTSHWLPRASNLWQPAKAKPQRILYGIPAILRAFTACGIGHKTFLRTLSILYLPMNNILWLARERYCRKAGNNCPNNILVCRNDIFCSLRLLTVLALYAEICTSSIKRCFCTVFETYTVRKNTVAIFFCAK